MKARKARKNSSSRPRKATRRARVFTPKTFWAPWKDLGAIADEKKPRLTPAMLKNAEKQLGVRLPKDYVELLRIQNSGYTDVPFIFRTRKRTVDADGHVKLDQLFGIGAGVEGDNEGYANILDVDFWEANGLPRKVIAICGDGHCCIALDYRKGAEPSVRWFDLECHHEQKLADTFAQFLDGLEKEPENRDEDE